MLSDTVEFCHKCENFYYSNEESDIVWNDLTIRIGWPQVMGEYKDSASAEGYALAEGTKLRPLINDF